MIRLRKSRHKELETKIGYRFRDPSLLDVALTHRSYRFENEGVEHDNQRLEYLGCNCEILRWIWDLRRMLDPCHQRS